MADTDPKLLGVVLCGGGSTRMGRDKAMLNTPNGTTFLDHACQRLQSLCDEVHVSSSLNRDTKFKIIADPAETHGPISGVHASLTYARSNGYDACVFNPVDTPCLTAGHVKTLIDVYRDHPGNIVCGADDDNLDQLQPLIAVYPTDAATAISDAISAGRYSLRKLLIAQHATRVPIAAAACRNINTPIEFQDWITR